MGGSGGGFFPPLRQTMTDEQINGYLRDKLRDYNDRDTEAINRHIRGLRDALEQTGNDVLPTRFGGSVSRHTYVDGLSDIDGLVRINDSSLAGQSPKAAIQKMAELIQRRMPNTKVETGSLAVTVKYTDGHEIQLLPAIRTRNGYRIANPTRNEWSGVIHPERFAQKLTQVNQANRGAGYTGGQADQSSCPPSHPKRPGQDYGLSHRISRRRGVQKLPGGYRLEEYGKAPDGLLCNGSASTYQ